MICNHFLLLMLLPLVASVGAARSTDDLLVIQNDEVVGRVEVERSGKTVHLDYAMDANSRGADLSVQLSLGDHGLPTEWRIEGSSLMGGSVKEWFEYDNGRARWSSQADDGERRLGAAPLYVANDGTPWDIGLYARALLSAGDDGLEVLPGGSMALTELDRLAVPTEAGEATVAAYRLSGLELEPEYLMLDADRRLFAVHRGRDSLVIRADFREQASFVADAFQSLRSRDMADEQQSLVHRFPGPVYLRNVRVFEPETGLFSEPSTVVVHGSRVVGIRSPDHQAPPDTKATFIDGEGGYLIPGLHDMHAHTTLMSGMFYLAAGVTSIRDMGNMNAWLLNHLERQAAGELIGPRISRAGFIEGRSEHSARFGKVVSSLDEALRAVDWYADHGYHLIKLYSSVKKEWIVPIIERSAEYGLPVSGHVPAFVRPDEVIEWGYADIAHINQLVLGWLLEKGEDSRTTLRLTAMKRTHELDFDSPRVQQTLAAMQDQGVALDTTAVILERLMASRAGEVPPGAKDYLEHAPIGYQRHRKRTFVPLTDEAEDRAYLESVDALVALLGRLHERGIQLLPGTDDTTGFTMHRELELYHQAGIPAADVLRLATSRAAAYLGREHRTGSIEKGKLADLVLLSANPLEDIRAIKRPRLVMKGGEAYVPAEIHRILGFEPLSTPPEISRP